MPIQLPDVSTSSVVTSRRQVSVSVKRQWGDAWGAVDYLRPLTLRLSAGPGVSTATFEYLAGEIKREDQSAYTFQFPLEIKEQWVKIELLPEDQRDAGGNPVPESDRVPLLLFLGRFSEESQDVGGGDRLVPPTDQNFTAYGIELLLGRRVIESSWSVNKTGTAFEIGVTQVFNERFGVGLSDIGNRANVKYSVDGTDPERSSYVFAGKGAAGGSSDPSPWTALNILEYVVSRYVPEWLPIELGTMADTGEVGVESPTVWEALRATVLPAYSIEGKTVKQVIDELVSRERGLGWCLRLSEQTDSEGTTTRLRLDVFSLVGEDVRVDDGILPGNKPHVRLPVHKLTNQQVSYQIDDLTRYDRIRVVGERVRSCFTVSFADATLEKAWTDPEETDYKSVAGADAAAKDDARQADRLSHVWTTFRIPRAWDWTAGNGEGGTKRVVNPEISSTDAKLDYDDAAAADSRDFGHRLQRTLPLRKQQLKEDAEAEFREPFAIVKFTEQDGTVTRWKFLHTLTKGVGCHFRTLDTELGFDLRLATNHMLARNHWEWAEGTDTKAKLQDAQDYEKIAATVAVLTDQRLLVDVTLQAGEGLGKTKLIEVPGASLWLVVPGTIIDINADGTLKRHTGNPIVRDDGGRLRQIAALAKAWYGTRRATLQLTIEEIDLFTPIGTYISQILPRPGGRDPRDINTVVTEVQIDFSTQRTVIMTSFCELDVIIRSRVASSLGSIPANLIPGEK